MGGDIILYIGCNFL